MLSPYRNLVNFVYRVVLVLLLSRCSTIGVKMNQIPIFAGLGSDSLFSKLTLDTATEDSKDLESQILLRACHRIFITEITSVICNKPSCSYIDPRDFDKPETLIRPPANYQRNSIIQHVSLYLIQLIRYIRYSKDNDGSLLAIGGFCAGLLPSAAVATSRNIIELLSRGQDFFYVALHLGIRIESYKQAEIARETCPPNLPWSVIVIGLSTQQAHELLHEHNKSVLLSNYMLETNF